MTIIKSSKFWVAVWSIFCITGVYAYAMYLEVKVPLEYVGFITGIASSFGLFKTYQNVALSNGNDNRGDNNVG